MSKKTIIIISSVLAVILIGLIAYYFILQGNKLGPDGKPQGFKGFFPFGGENSTTTVVVEEPVQEEPVKPVVEDFTQKLRKISSEPVSGFGLTQVPAGTVLRYIEKATGHIYEVELFSPKKERISNATVPLSYDAVWGEAATSFIARYLKDDNQTVDTFSFKVRSGTGTTTLSDNNLSGIVFPANITDVSVASSSVFYLENGAGFSTGFVSNFDGGKKKQIWNSPITELLSQFVNPKTVALTTKPYQNLPGYLYMVDTTTGGVKNYLGGVMGLSTLVDPLATKILYLSQSDTVRLFIFDIKTNLSLNTSPATFPEKCAWGVTDKSAIYCATPREFLESDSMTNWYLGLASFTDDIWKYNTSDGLSSMIENLQSDSGEVIDVIKPSISQNGQYLVFVNKIDNSLWSLDLSK
jgi:hypothetical protein